MVDAELSVPPGARLRGSPLIAGTRAYVMTRADYDGLVLSAATQSVNGPTRDQQSQRVTLGFRGGQTTLYSRNFSLGPAAGDTQSTGATVELYGQDLVSSDLAPSLLSVTVQSERSSSPSSQMQGSMASADLAWSTRWGETIVSYWQDQKTGTDVFGAAAECDRLIDISQQFSIGHWRGSLGADYQSFASASNRGGSDESGLSGHTSFAYAVPGAPELKFGIERRKEDTFFEDFLAPSHSTALDLSLGIDFTPYLQSELASGQVHASLEYRRQLRGDRSKTARDEQEATDALREVDPSVGTTVAGFLVGSATVPSFFYHHQAASSAVAVVGMWATLLALSKRSVMSTACFPNEPVAPSRHTAIGIR